MTTGTAAAPERRGLGRVFWLLCSMEMWERLAYYGVRVVAPVYIAQADEPGGLHFSQADKGTIYFWWFVFQSVLPTFTGGLADRYGYKRTIAFAITIKVLGYGMMATQRDFTGFFIGTMLLATGTALFKPGIQGSLAQTLDRSSASRGWGVFYWLVNVGAALGPPLAGILRQMSWPMVFYACAGIVSLNYLMLLTYKEPDSGWQGGTSVGAVLKTTFANLLEPRLVSFLLLLSGFWLMMYQLWDLHPNFVTDWTDSGAVASFVPASWTQQTDRGVQVLQENLLNLNAALIVLLVVPISAVSGRFKTLTAMLGGMVVAIFGILVSGLTQSGWVFLLGVLLFSLGEMLTGPKKNEYLGLIAPPGKKGLYLGYVNIPVGIGGAVGSKLAGWLYGSYGEKAVLSQRYLAEHTDFLQKAGKPAWDGEVASLAGTLGVDRAGAYDALKAELGQSGAAVTDLLWQTYAPWKIWFVFAAIGLLSAIGLWIFARMARRWDDLNV
ncbi:MAG: MFS transporter [Deltaproteobacteria bacterium]|nr:MFS transporter [Deltaproteobacteria bacterium]